MQTMLPASDAKSFAVEKSLSSQVQAFMDANGAAGRPLSAGGMAALVAKHQQALPADQRCKRQDIENLLKKDFKTTRYLVALAAAMGTTAEALLGERVRKAPVFAGDPFASAGAAPAMSGDRITRYVADVFRSLEEFASELNQSQRKSLKVLIGDLLSNPEGFAHLDRDKVRSLLSDNAYTPGLVETPSASSDPFTNLDEQSVTNGNQPLQRPQGNVPALPTTPKRRASGAR